MLTLSNGTLSPYFVCLSMIVSGERDKHRETFGAIDGLAYALQREGEVDTLPPLVERSVAIFESARGLGL